MARQEYPDRGLGGGRRLATARSEPSPHMQNNSGVDNQRDVMPSTNGQSGALNRQHLLSVDREDNQIELWLVQSTASARSGSYRLPACSEDAKGTVLGLSTNPIFLGHQNKVQGEISKSDGRHSCSSCRNYHNGLLDLRFRIVVTPAGTNALCRRKLWEGLLADFVGPLHRTTSKVDKT